MKPCFRNLFHWMIQVLGTFFFVFFIMHSIVINTMGICALRWQIPYLSLPAYIVCVTIGVKYWIGEDSFQLRAFFFSTIVSAVLLLMGTVFTIPSYVSMIPLREVVNILLLIGIVLYAILRVRAQKSTTQRDPVNESTLHTHIAQIKQRQVIRVLCLLSICCILFENCQSAILITYNFMTKQNLALYLVTISPFPLSILSAILLAKFVKTEFVQQIPPNE
jgi:hypothetical protein